MQPSHLHPDRLLFSVKEDGDPQIRSDQITCPAASQSIPIHSLLPAPASSSLFFRDERILAHCIHPAVLYSTGLDLQVSYDR